MVWSGGLVLFLPYFPSLKLTAPTWKTTLSFLGGKKTPIFRALAASYTGRVYTLLRTNISHISPLKGTFEDDSPGGICKFPGGYRSTLFLQVPGHTMVNARCSRAFGLQGPQVSLHRIHVWYTLPETNSKFAPENWWLENCSFPFWDTIFSGAIFVLGRYISTFGWFVW